LVVDLGVLAVALGLSNFAPSVAIGLSGVDGRMRVRVAVVFGFFEAATPIVGLVVGKHVAGSLVSASGWVGGGLLMATGGNNLWRSRGARSEQTPGPGRGSGQSSAAPPASTIGLVLTGAALSIDNLVAGFALGTHKVPVVLAAATIAAVRSRRRIT
jgi:manganese efflux pump family protein